jgi:uncharacterized protein YdeI (YjbR/CyaY-like superfamily)
MQLLEVADGAAWRAWLGEHGGVEREVWLVFWKRHTGRVAVDYEEAVEEALCFGWIDSLVRRVDDDRYAQKFTPRKPASAWSTSNLRRFAKLEREGRMTAVGRALGPPPEVAATTAAAAATAGSTVAAQAGGTAAATAGGAAGSAGAVGRGAVELPAYLEAGLRAHPAEWAYFSSLAPSHRRNYVRWIDSAKRQETRERRLAEALTLLAQKQQLGLK